MKIVIDTNTLISGIFWGERPYEVLDLWINGKISLLISEKILSEYIKVIKEISSKKKSFLYEDWEVFILEHSILIQAPSIVNVCRDPGDNIFLDCAISGEADYIISGDKDLLELQQIKGIKIVNSSIFLKMMKID